MGRDRIAAVRRQGALLIALCLLTGIWGGPAAGAGELAANEVALRHRIQLPGGSQILLRREYRVIFRTPMRWSEGMLLERVYVAGDGAGDGALRAA
jgi:hypothetical protein